MKNIFWAIQAAIFYALTLLAALVPAAGSRRAGALIGLCISRILPKRRAIVSDNLNRALPFMRCHPLWNPPHPDARALSRESF